MVAWLALGQSYGFLNAIDVMLNGMGKMNSYQTTNTSQFEPWA